MSSDNSQEVLKSSKAFPRAFLERRLHSLTGLFLILFLLEHLLTNSQAALWIGDDGAGFIRFVNIIHSLPYLFFIECFLLGVPFLLHLVLGFFYLKEAHYNSVLGSKKGDKPHFNYPRSRAYTWQRLTAWLLLVGVVAHVVHLRVLRNPPEVFKGVKKSYLACVSFDPGLVRLVDRLNTQIVTSSDTLSREKTPQFPQQMEQRLEKEKQYINQIQQLEKPGYVVLDAPSFGAAMLFILRDVFKSPLICLSYTFFVLSAVYHAMNGFWTAMISWGIAATVRSQNSLKNVSRFMMGLLAFLGLCSIWLSYWVNLFD
jgi:succinate dehydrogenase / fumarate reductase cytochrome b subunit